jgi:hypothetical protein
VLAIDLDTGKVTTVRYEDPQSDKYPWAQPQVSPSPVGGDYNADRSWGIKHVSVNDPGVDPDPARQSQERDVVVRPDGSELVPRPGTTNWRFDRWLDLHTVVGFANENLRDPDDPEVLKPSSLLTCTVPDGACTLIPDSDFAMLPTPSLR